MPAVAKRKTGRPSKLTPERIKVLCAAVEAGMTLAHAAECADIHPDTFSRWINSEEARFIDLRRALTRAKARGILTRLKRIQTAGRTDWRADAWWLEATTNGAYSRKVKHEVTGQGGGPIVLKWPDQGDGDGDDGSVM